MTTGIISYLSQRGLGTMCHDLREHLGITRQLVIPDIGWPMHLEWANGEEFYLHQWEVQKDDLSAWQSTDGIDTVISIETGFGDHTFRYAKELGMRTILIVMWESFNPHLPAYQSVDLYICPSFKAYQEVPFDNKVFLPYPVDTNLFKFRQRSGPARQFIHNAGSGGMNGRKGTRETVEAFLKADPGTWDATLRINSQVDQPWFGEIRSPYVTFNIGGFMNREDLYTQGDVLIYPSKYDGHALVTLEAMASGMPVLTTDAEPMNEYWPAGHKMLTGVRKQEPAGMINPHCLASHVDTYHLAEQIRWAGGTDMERYSTENRQIAEVRHSWSALRDRWMYRLEKR
jgi:glycosyltransferase involved in cell wall biosynthesis